MQFGAMVVSSFDSISANKVEGNCVANAAEALTTINYKVITPSTLQSWVQAIPVKLGSITPGSAKFTDVACTSLSTKTLTGDCAASQEDIVNGTANDKFVSPAMLKMALANPGNVVGGVSGGAFADLLVTGKLSMPNYKLTPPQGGTGIGNYIKGDMLVATSNVALARLPIGRAGQFLAVDFTSPTNVKWTTLPGTLPASTSSAGIITLATSTEAVNALNNTKAITPATLASALSSPGSIGNVKAAPGKFTTLEAQFIGGTVVATPDEAVSYISSKKMIVPSHIPQIMASPGPIGGNTASTGTFTIVDCSLMLATNLEVVNAPWKAYKPNYTLNSDMTRGIATNKAATPASVKHLMYNPFHIGLSKPNAATFTNLAAKTLSVEEQPWPFLENDKYNVDGIDKTVTPFYVNDSLKSPQVIIGADNPNDAVFKRVDCDNLYGMLGDDVNAFPAFITNATIGELHGDVLATDDDVIDKNKENVVVRPSNLSILMSYPGPIGDGYANVATFTDITANALFGEVIATVEEVQGGVLTEKVVCPATLDAYMQAPNAIGVIPNTGGFTDLTAKALYGEVIATQADVSAGESTTTVVTPATLKLSLETPPPIGLEGANAGKFTTLEADSLTGTVHATYDDVYNGTGPSLVVGPATLATYVKSPNVIGEDKPNDAKFKALLAETSLESPKLTTNELLGGVVASNEEILDHADNTKVVTPVTLEWRLLRPPVIGDEEATDAYFKALHATSLQGEVIASSVEVAEGLLDTKVMTPLSFSGYMKSPGPIGDEKANEGHFTNLSADHLYGPIGSDTNANSGYFTTVTASKLEGPIFADEIEAYNVESKYQIVSPYTLQYVLQRPPEIGAEIQSSARFLNVDLTSVTGSGVATIDDVTESAIDNKVITPKVLYEAFRSPPPIGSPDFSNAAYFTTVTSGLLSGQLNDPDVFYNAYVSKLTASSIAGDIIATLEQAVDPDVTDRIITPATLYTILNNLPYTVTGAQASFTTLQSEQLYGQLGNDAFASDAYINILYAKGIAGDVVATQDEVYEGLVDNRFMVPSTFIEFVNKPGPIGELAQNTGKFTTLTALEIQGVLGSEETQHDAFVDNLQALTVSGGVVATFDDVSVNPTNDKVITPVTLNAVLDAPPIIGGSQANTAFFTTITLEDTVFGTLGSDADYRNAYVNELVAKGISGDFINTATELRDGSTSATTLVSGDAFLDFWSDPTITLGNGTSDAILSTVTAKELTGECIATLEDITAADVPTSKVVGARTLIDVLEAPGNIVFGGDIPIVKLNADELVVSKFSGSSLATLDDLLLNVAGKVVSSDALRAYFDAAISIGAANDSKTIGNFKSLTSGTLYGQVGDVTRQDHSFFKNVHAESVSGAVCAVQADVFSKSVNKLVTPALLSDMLQFSVQGTSNASFGDVTVSKITISDDVITAKEGGTGIDHYTQGSLLVGKADGGLVQMTSGLNTEVLTVDTSTASGLRWRDPPYPPGFTSIGYPKYVSNSNTMFTIGFCSCRSADNTVNINITSGRTVSGPTSVLSVNVAGTVSSNGTLVTTSDADFSQLFVTSDVISVSVDGTTESRRIVSVSSATTMTIESAFSSNVSGVGFKRGGFAPNTHYYVYATASGYALHTRSIKNGDTLEDVSSPYAQLPVVFTTDASSKFYQNVYVQSYTAIVPNNKTFTVSNAFQYVDASSVVPRTAKGIRVTVRLKNNSSTDCDLLLRATPNDEVVSLGGGLGIPAGSYASATLDVSMDAFRRFQASTTQLLAAASVTITGYYT